MGAVYKDHQHFTQPVIPLPPTQPNPTMDTVQKGPVDPTLVPGVHPTPTSGGPVAPVKGGVVLPPVTPKGVGPVEVVTPTAKMKGPPPPVTKIGAGVELAPTDTAAPASGTQYRVRIAQLGKTEAADELRAYLSQHGIETELEITRGNYVLFSAVHGDSRKAKDLADQINKRLEDFEKDTRIPTSHDAYPVPVKKE